MQSTHHALLQSDTHMLMAMAEDAASSPSSTSSPSPRHSDTFPSNNETLEDIAALMTTSRSAAAVSASAAKQAKPKLAVSASGRFQDQFYHTQEASRAMGIFKNRAIVKQTTDGQRSDATVKRKKSINVNGRDVEQFSDADIVFAGYLVKQGSFWKTWRRRYFILRRDVNVLAYYTSQENLVKLGEIVIDATTRVEPPSSAATSAFPGRFTVEHNGRKLVLVAEDGRESAETWAKIIGRCITTRTAEAEAAALTALMGSSRGSSERESMRSSLMQLRSSMNGSQLTPQDGATKKPVRVISSANSMPAPLPPAAPAAPATAAVEPVKLESFKKGLVPVDQPQTDATRANSTMMEPVSGKENAAANSATKMKRHSTDSVVIQAAADEAVLRRGSMGLNDAGRDRLVHNARLKSIDSANDSARKLLDTKAKAPARSNSTEAAPSAAGKVQSSAGRASAPAPRRLFRSYSAGSVLSTRSIEFNDMRSTHDDCGLLSAHMSSRGSYPDPNSNKHLRVDRETRDRNGTNADSGSDTRSRNLSLPSLRPVASVELSVSVGCRGTQDVSYMLVVLSAIAPTVNRGEAKELARTEVQGALSLRACGGDFFARDFSALLSVPISASARNLMLQFEIFSVTNLSTENLTVQQSLGFVRIPHTDLLFSGDSTLVLECLRARQSPSKQKHFLVLDRIRPSESLNLGHSYVYAKRHFVADIVPVGASSTDMVTWITTSTTAAVDKPGNRSSFETVATSPAASTATDSSRSSLTYAGMIRGNLESADATQVFISEELSSSYCSISVAAKYMGLLQQRNRRRMHDAKLLINDIEQKYEKMPSSPNSRTEAGDIINLHSEMIRDAETRVEYYRKLYESYVECEDYYDVLLAMLEDGKEPGITGSLKRSVQKKDKRTEFMPTNLNCHVVRARRVALSSSAAAASTKDPGTRERSLIGGAKGDELVYAVVTHGCPAAHCLGFKDGGLRRLQASLAQSKEDDPRLRERVEQRQDVVHCQILAIASASFLTVIGLSANQSARHQERLRLMCQTGFLLNMESLLSTIKNEKGMIEDMYEGVQWLNANVSVQVVQSLEESPKLKCAKCVAITSSEKREVVATFALPSDVFATLPEVLKHGHALKVHAVMFTQGINEMQSVANTVLDTSLQDEINLESATRLVRYFQVYKTHVLAMQPPNQDRIDDLADLEIELQIVAEKLNQSRKSHVQKKNVNILIESSDLCRRLGAGRTTCCKSGKDRTAMSVTLECSRLLVDKFHVRQGVHLTNAMRERGVRRVNVLANTGKNKFAFNSFQLKYLPDCYRPPVLSADSSVQS